MPIPQQHLTLGDAVEHVMARSFPEEGGDLVGLELEWLTIPAGGVPALPAPTRRQPGGSSFTREPGGQIEVSSAPFASVSALCRSLRDEVADLRLRLAPLGAQIVGIGLVPDALAPRVVETPRYDAMAAFFEPDGPAGSVMMTSTASVQVNIGIGRSEDHERRWRLANVLGPVLAAAFANSPVGVGVPTGFRSTRLANWFAIDPTRTAPAWRAGQGCRSWAAYVVGARVMMIRRADGGFGAVPEPLSFARWLDDGHELGFPTIDDLDYHLTTLFPPVRPKGWLELRFIDALPTPWWQVVPAVTAALLLDPEAGALAERAAAPFARAWRQAAVHGLAHPGLAAAAQACFGAARQSKLAKEYSRVVTDTLDDYTDRFVARGRTPADDRLDAWRRCGSVLLDEDGDVRVAALA